MADRVERNGVTPALTFWDRMVPFDAAAERALA